MSLSPAHRPDAGVLPVSEPTAGPPSLRPLAMPSDASEDLPGQGPWEREPSADEHVRFRTLFEDLVRRQPTLQGQQWQLRTCLTALQRLTQAVVRALTSDASPRCAQHRRLREVLQDLEAVQAWLLSVEVLLERTGEITWPQAVERLCGELVGELAPDPHSFSRLQLNRWLELPATEDHEPL